MDDLYRPLRYFAYVLIIVGLLGFATLLIKVLHRLDEVGLAQNKIDLIVLFDLDGLHLYLHKIRVL